MFEFKFSTVFPFLISENFKVQEKLKSVFYRLCQNFSWESLFENFHDRFSFLAANRLFIPGGVKNFLLSQRETPTKENMRENFQRERKKFHRFVNSKPKICLRRFVCGSMIKSEKIQSLFTSRIAKAIAVYF